MSFPFLVILVCIFARIQTEDRIQKYTFDNDGLGNYSFYVSTGDDVQTGFLHKQQGHFDGELKVEGRVFYKVDETLFLTVDYVADRNGYRPKVGWLFLPKAVIRSEGEVPEGKKPISSTVIATLTGGNGK